MQLSKAAVFTGMSGGGSFGSMDNLGNVGNFGGRMTGEFSFEKLEKTAHGRPLFNPTECTDLPLNVALNLWAFGKY